MIEPKKTHDQNSDPLLRKIDPGVLETFSETQLAEITSLLKNFLDSKGKHIVDVRGTLHLVFTRIYFCFLMGIDRRKRKEHANFERRVTASMLTFVLFWMFAFLSVVTVLITAYLIFSVPLGENFPQSR